MNKIIILETFTGTKLLVVPDGNGGVNHLQLNGKPYTGSCENLTVYCCSKAEENTEENE